MFKLMVSHDCGISYHEEATAETVEELLPKGEKLDEELLRWTIDDEADDIVIFCDIHHQMVATMAAIMLR
ncbi:hypothetical protein LCGC14_3071140, partial [marine sediment metagenome]